MSCYMRFDLLINHFFNTTYFVDQDVFMNLHKEYSKTVVQKALDQLVDDGRLKEKINGKQKYYVNNQVIFHHYLGWSQGGMFK